jgi:large subunit ribosomal protein L22
VTARKVNQVLDLVRGQDVEAALNTLSFSKKHVARTVEKTMRSAVANAIQADSKVDVEDLYVKEARVGPGPIMKRWLPRAQGRATPLLKRMSHITIILDDKASRRKKKGKGASRRPAAAPAASAAPAAPARAKKTSRPARKKTAKKKTAGKTARTAKA